MFIFEDISTLDDAAIREIIQRVDKKTISQALKGSNETQQRQFYRNMSGRAVEMMREEMEIMGPVKAKDVHTAQQKIVEVVRKLEEEGLINMGGGRSGRVSCGSRASPAPIRSGGRAGRTPRSRG